MVIVAEEIGERFGLEKRKGKENRNNFFLRTG